MLLEGSSWGYKKITATFTSSRTGLSDVVIRTTKCTKAIASISSVVSRHATQRISLFSVAILKKETAVPIFRNDVRVVKSKIELLFDFPPSLIWADMSIHFFRKPNFSFSCFEHYKVSHLLSQVLSMKFCAVNAWVCLSSPNTLKKEAFFFKTLVKNHTVALERSARRSRNYIIHKQTNILLFKDKQTNKLKKKTISWDISENGFLRTLERVWISQRRQTFVADRESTVKDTRKCDSST